MARTKRNNSYLFKIALVKALRLRLGLKYEEVYFGVSCIISILKSVFLNKQAIYIANFGTFQPIIRGYCNFDRWTIVFIPDVSFAEQIKLSKIRK